MRATAAGSLLFGAGAADDLPDHDVLVYDSLIPIKHAEIDFRALTLPVTDGEGEEAEGEAYFAEPAKTRVKTNSINIPDALQQLLIDDALRTENNETWLARIDENESGERLEEDWRLSVDQWFGGNSNN